MFLNYLKISLRNLAKHKVFSFLNIFGLALSMSVCLLLIMLVKDAFQYDRFHPEGDRVFRVLTTPVRKEGRTERYASSPFILGKTLKEECPQVEAWVPLIRGFSGNIEIDEQRFSFNGLLTDNNFFEIFGFDLAFGDEKTAFNDPYALVLTNELAESMFGNANPVGQTLKVPGYAAPFRVTGVLTPFAGKTHLEFTALGSVETQYAEERQPEGYVISTEWRNYYATYNFVRLHNVSAKSEADAVLDQIAQSKYAGLELESRDAGYHFSLQPMHNITPGGMLSNAMGRGMPVILLTFLGILGAIVIFSACFNYTNLTIARALIRTKEIGVRKVLGASRKQVFAQITSEAVVTALCALAIAFLLLKVVKPQFARLSITESFDISIREDWQLYGMFLLFTIVIGVLAGFLPAFTLSKTKPVAVLQKLQNLRLIKRLGLRKVLLTSQFTVTLVFLITMTIAWRQTTHAIANNFGFDQPQTLLVQRQTVPYDQLFTAFSQVSGVESISGISFPMGTWLDGSDDVRIETADERRAVRQYFIDHQYLEQFDIALVAGEPFPENPTQQREQFAIVNETFIREFGLGEPGDAIDKPIILGDSTDVVISGVTEDFPFKPAVYTLEPLLLRYQPQQLRTLNVKLSGRDIPSTLAALEAAWETVAPDTRFEPVFFADEVRNNYAESLDLLRIVGFFGMLGLVIACMGLLGLAIYTMETKAKEISIRKVLGANVRDVITLLSRSYVWLFVIAICIAVPISYLLSRQMLQIYADRIPLTVFLFLPGILVVLVTAMVTIGSQAIKAALANPVTSLHSE